MNIDFPPSSNGIYNNAGSSRQLVNYMEHEDMERIAHGLSAEGFFNLTDDGIYKSEVIQRINGNIGQLMKTDAKFYAIHVSPSAKELAQMGKTEQEQSDAMKRYIREVFIPAYAQNFNKGLSVNDILFYGKIHFSRERSDKASFMHCHLIVSRKDQANKRKISPATNHRNTKKGVIKGGFDRKTLFQQAESGFDKLFGYQRNLQETFIYCNTMKNGTIGEKLEMQEKEFKNEIQLHDSKSINQYNDETLNQHDNKGINLPDVSSVFGLLTPEVDNRDFDDSIPLQKRKKKKKPTKKNISINVLFSFGKQRYIPRIKRQHRAASGFTRNLHTCAALRVVFLAKVLLYLFFSIDETFTK